MTLLLLAACNQAAEDTALVVPTLDPPAEGEGFQLAIEGTVGPYEEIWLCVVYPLPVDETSGVQSIEYLQNDDTHHMTLSVPGYNRDHGIDYGTYDCNDLYTSTSLMEEATMIYGNQGAGSGTLSLPEGTVANLPPEIDIVHEIHYVNPTDQELPIYSIVNAYTIPQDEIENQIYGGSVRDEHINIPAESSHTEWTRCLFNEDVDVLFLASHMHERGDTFTIAEYDGETVGPVFYENDDWHDPKIIQYETPIARPAGTGFEFTCTWDNTEAVDKTYGLTADDEMCNMAVVFSPFSLTARCEVVESSDGELWEG